MKGEVSEKRKSGKIKFYNVQRGYGFIREDVTHAEIYFDRTALPGIIPPSGKKCTFDTILANKGLRAVDVKVRSAI